MRIKCRTCGRTRLIEGAEIELKEDGTLLTNGEEKTCPACGRKRFKELKEV